MTSSSSQNEDTPENKEKKEATLMAYNMIAQGRRNMICGEYGIAVSQYQEACELLSKWYGDMARECAEAYFLYGSALLELARLETGVLGGALQEGVAEEEEMENDSDEQADNSTEDSEAETENFEKDNNTEDSNSKEAVEEERKDGEGSTGQRETKETENPSDNADDVKEGCSTEKNEDDDDDDSSLKVAWEMLDLAKVIFLRSGTVADKLKAAEAYMKLGEVSLESEKIDLAIEDFKASLEILKQHKEPTNRTLATTYYQLGMAHGLIGDHQSSAEYYIHAVKSMEGKIAELEKAIEEKSSNKGKGQAELSDAVSDAHDEIKELKAIIPEIYAKIEEAEAEEKSTSLQMKETKKLAMEAMGVIFDATLSSTSLPGFSPSSQPFSSAASSSSAPLVTTAANDISHLVRRKRKPDEIGEEAESKKLKPECGSGDQLETVVENSTPSLEPQSLPCTTEKSMS